MAGDVRWELVDRKKDTQDICSLLSMRPGCFVLEGLLSSVLSATAVFSRRVRFVVGLKRFWWVVVQLSALYLRLYSVGIFFRWDVIMEMNKRHVGLHSSRPQGGNVV